MLYENNPEDYLYVLIQVYNYAVDRKLLYLLHENNLKDLIRINFFIYSFLIALIILTPFFLAFFNNYGSITGFNKDSLGFDFRNQPISFIIQLTKFTSKVFTKPIRGNFDNQVLPCLYADLWGDYWDTLLLFFVFKPSFNKIYLARVNTSFYITYFFIDSWSYKINEEH